MPRWILLRRCCGIVSLEVLDIEIWMWTIRLPVSTFGSSGMVYYMFGSMRGRLSLVGGDGDSVC